MKRAPIVVITSSRLVEHQPKSFPLALDRGFISVHMPAALPGAGPELNPEDVQLPASLNSGL